MIRKTRLVAVGVAAAMLALTACSSSKSSTPSAASNTSSAPAAATTSSAPAGGASSAPAGGASSAPAAAVSSEATGSPLLVAFMTTLTGADTNPNWDQSVKLAISSINSTGGILGHKVEYKGYDSNENPQAATTATNLALSDKPWAVVGYGVSATAIAAAPAIKKAGVFWLNQSTSTLTSAATLGYTNMFRFNTSESTDVAVAVQFIQQQIHPKKVGIIYSTDAADTYCFQDFKKGLEGIGATVTDRTTVFTATDETQQALGMKGTDMVIVCSAGNVISLSLNSLRQQGTNVPYLGAVTMNVQVANGVISKQTIAAGPLYQIAVGCNADESSTPAAVAFRSIFTKAYGANANILEGTPSLYDALYLLKLAAEKANSIDATAMTAAMKTITYDGACGTFHNDQFNNLLNTLAIEKYDNTGALSIVYQGTGNSEY
jgi:branched-chain amino acid transport system substrate-binding protein